MTVQEQTGPGDVDSSRRTLLKVSIAGVLAAGAVGARVADSAPAASRSAPRLNGPIFYDVETTHGVVRGIADVGIKSFRGIPYGADTGGKNRCMPPRPPAPWTGARNCVGYGPISPQTQSSFKDDYGQLIMWDRHVGCGGMGEDCLNLNVWTPGPNDNAKRAVLVSFHGGGWATGSANGPMYDGGQLALLGDVVVVTVNHRLASFGYTHLASLGGPPEFKTAGVCGVMDMVASLEWVRDNITAFGGDPNRVMIFGQSGGGAKTSVLLATPAAAGLFHRAAVQSGSTLRLVDEAAAAKSAELLLAKLGIPRNRLADIQNISWEMLLQAQIEVSAGFTPVMDGHYLPHHPFDPLAPPESRNVPMIISTTLEDAALRLSNWDLGDSALADLVNRALQRQGEGYCAFVPRGLSQQVGVPDPGADTHRQRRAGPGNHAGRAQGGAGRGACIYVCLGVGDARVRRQVRRRAWARRGCFLQSLSQQHGRQRPRARTRDGAVSRIHLGGVRQDWKSE